MEHLIIPNKENFLILPFDFVQTLVQDISQEDAVFLRNFLACGFQIKIIKENYSLKIIPKILLFALLKSFNKNLRA